MTFSYNNTAIELVNSFKHLGLTLFKNGNWNRSQKCIAQHASFALSNLFTVFNNVDLPISQKCKLFDTLLGSDPKLGQKFGETIRLPI